MDEYKTAKKLVSKRPTIPYAPSPKAASSPKPRTPLASEYQDLQADQEKLQELQTRNNLILKYISVPVQQQNFNQTLKFGDYDNMVE